MAETLFFSFSLNIYLFGVSLVVEHWPKGPRASGVAVHGL